PPADKPGFAPRLARSFGGLVTIGGGFLVSAAGASIAAGRGGMLGFRVALVAGLLVVNGGFFLRAFPVFTAADVTWRQLLPGSIAGAVGFTALITVGAGLVQHQLRHSSATYGALGAVIGVVTFLLLLAQMSIYAAQLNPVLARRMWPRALPTT